MLSVYLDNDNVKEKLNALVDEIIEESKRCGNCKYGCSIKPEDHICGECSRYYDDLYEKKG